MNVITLSDALQWLTAGGAAVLGSMLSSYLGEHWAWFQKKSTAFKRLAMPAVSGVLGLAAWAVMEYVPPETLDKLGEPFAAIAVAVAAALANQAYHALVNRKLA